MAFKDTIKEYFLETGTLNKKRIKKIVLAVPFWVILAAVILIAAGFLIYNRIGVIMDYPAKLAEQQAKGQAEQQLEESEAAEATEATDSTQATESTEATTATEAAGDSGSNE